jgi:hypothetical protein
MLYGMCGKATLTMSSTRGKEPANRTNHPAHQFDSSDSESSRIDALSQLLGATNPVQDAFDRSVAIIISALASPAVFMRTKGLRAIGQIVTCDPALLSQVSIR